MEEIVKKLAELNKTIATMESCTGGYIVNKITNIKGSSDVLKFSAVTYSNEFKIKMGVNKEIIDKHSVYSQEVADEMSLNISKFTGSNYGIGITGKLLRKDENNDFGKDNEVFISLYNSDTKEYKKAKVTVIYDLREQNKDLVYKNVVKLIKEELNI